MENQKFKLVQQLRQCLGPCCADSLFKKKKKGKNRIILNMQSRVREKGVVPAILPMSLWGE